MSYSQNQEEAKIVEYFNGRIGRFLDIGAYTGKGLSNTLRLVELGWEGVCVEPSPGPFAMLNDLHKDNPRIQCINAAITPVSGEIDFWDSNGDAVSTTSDWHKQKWECGNKDKFKRIKVQSLTAAELVKLCGEKFDFVSIDTEATNLGTLEAFIAAGLRFELLCIEHDNYQPQIVAMFPGCQPIEVNAENLIIYYNGWK
jgi:FkbM family methyltransferase